MLRPAFLAVLLTACRTDAVDFSGSLDTAAPSALSPQIDLLQLDSAGSGVSFVSYKDDMVPVSFDVHHPGGTLGLVDGSLESAYGKVLVPLAGIDSDLEVRDSRVMEVFFGLSDANRYVTFDFNGMDVAPLGEGEWAAAVSGTVTIAGVSQPATASLHITRDGDSLLMTTAEPLVLSIEGFGLSARLADLIALCGHDTIDDGVEVDVALRFDLF